jgi:hypothetical protein
MKYKILNQCPKTSLLHDNFCLCFYLSEETPSASSSFAFSDLSLASAKDISPYLPNVIVSRLPFMR